MELIDYLGISGLPKCVAHTTVKSVGIVRRVKEALTSRTCCILLILAVLFVMHKVTRSTPVIEERPSIFDQHKPIQNPKSGEPIGKKFVFENHNVFEMGTRNLSCSAELQIKRPPSGLIIGEKKCGTSALMVFLSLHPHIALPTQEMSYFSNPKNFLNDTTKEYVKRMPVTCPDDVTMEKSPKYARDPTVASRVYNFNKAMRMILFVRDPVQRLLSDYAMTVRMRPEETISLESLVLTEKDGFLSVNGESSLVRISMYSEHLENWLSVFPRDQLLILDGDKFIVENPARSSRDVATFMGVDSYYEDDMFYYDSKKGYYCLTKEGCLPDAKGHSLNVFTINTSDRLGWSRDQNRHLNDRC